MRDVADVVSAGVQRKKKLNDDRSRHEQLHRNRDGKRKKPNLAVWKQNARGDQDAVNCPGSANRRNRKRKTSPVRIEDYFDEDVDKTGADPGQKIIFIKAALPPGPFQIHSEEIQKQHVHDEMPDRGMQEQVGRELPDIQASRDVPGNQTEQVLELRRVIQRENQLDDRLKEKNAGSKPKKAWPR